MLLFVTLLTFTACKKDEDSPKTAKDYLTAGFWKMTAGTIDPGIDFGGTVITDFYAFLDACEKDDLTRFNADGTITDDEGATKCDPDDPQTTTDGSWVLSADNKTVTMSYPGEDPTSMTIGTLNESTFVGTYTIVEDFGGGPVSYTFTITLKLQ